VARARSYYEILGVAPGASAQDIHRAFRRRAREHHPDVSSGAQAGARFHEVAEAYEVLHDPARRAHYDRANRPVAAPRRPASDVPRFIDDEPPAARYDMPGPIRLSIRIDLGLFLRWPRW